VLGDEFETFWKRYPRRVGKLAAMKAYRKARTLATDQEILDGVDRYIAAKPAYADWCFPATFLNQGRWLDELDPVTSLSYDWHCPHTPHCPHRAACAIVALRTKG
jgi:hypothetical protein